MSSNDSAQDRNLPASERKKTKAREQGQVPRSRDLGHFAALLVAGLLISGLAPLATHWLQKLLEQGLRFDAQTVADPQLMLHRTGEFLWALLALVLPLGLALALASVLVAVLSGGWNFSWQALQPKWSKIDPVQGLGRVFSKDQLIQALKACGLALILGLIAFVYLRSHLGEFLAGMSLSLPGAFSHSGQVLAAGLIGLLIALAVFAGIDVPLQRFTLARNLRMSRQELKQEHKEVEGNAEVKAKQKARMREAANRRMLAAVPKADLVVMNPTHFAVALRYDGSAMAAPKVVAKGADLMAFRIRDAAREAQVPVLEAPPLARALYAHSDVDREIPAALFSAVAQVLAWVYQLKAAMAGQGRPPGDLPDLQVPAELDPLNKHAASPARTESEPTETV